jgi:hypothetical protein
MYANTQRQSTFCYQQGWNDCNNQILIDPEFQSLIPPLSDDEQAQLEANLINEGCLAPLIVWKGHNILLDGHNRFQLCMTHALEFQTVEVALPDRESALTWIIENQLGRRNLTPEGRAYLRGTLYNTLKAKVSNPTGKNQYQVSGHFDHQANSIHQTGVSGQNDHHPKTEEKLASLYRVGARTIRRDAQFAQAVDTLATVVGDDIRPAILTRKAQLSKKYVLKMAQTATRDPDAVRQKFGQTPRNKSRQLPQPFSVGEVVRIVEGDDPQLKGKLGYWCIITAITDFTCSIQFWNGTATLIKPEWLESLNFTPEQCQARKVLCTRLNQLAQLKPELIVYRLLLDLGRRTEAQLTQMEMNLLEFMERELSSKHILK